MVTEKPQTLDTAFSTSEDLQLTIKFYTRTKMLFNFTI